MSEPIPLLLVAKAYDTPSTTMIAGSGKLDETRGPMTDANGFEAGSVCALVDCGCGAGSGDRMTASRGHTGPKELTADEASRYAGMATMARRRILVRNESIECRRGSVEVHGMAASLCKECVPKP